MGIKSANLKTKASMKSANMKTKASNSMAKAYMQSGRGKKRR